MKQLRENWVIILFLGTVIMSWTMFSSRLTQAEQDIKDLKIAVSEFSDVKVEIAKISTTVEFIKNRVK